MNKTTIAAAATLALAAPGIAAAADFPNKQITMIVPFAAGGPTDTVGRLISGPMSKALGQQIVIDNTTGAGGTVGTRKAARARPDGHTILLWHIGMSTSPTLYRKLPFKPLADFEYIGLVNDVPMTLIARKDLPPNDLKSLIEYVKKNKEKITLANAGLGAASHLCGLLFQQAIGVDLTTVAYKGTAPAVTDLLGGHVDLLCDQTTNTVPQIAAGKVKAYVVTAPERVASIPDVPTAKEAGLPGFEVSIWHGLYAPKGTPKAAVDKLTAALQAALKDEAVNKRFADLGAKAVSMERATPAALQAHLKSEIDRWAPLIKKGGQYAD